MPMRKILLALLVGLSVAGWGQSIGGIVNKYYKVTGIDFNKSEVTVANLPQGELATGDQVMIIQMKGATISPTNGSGAATSGQVATNNYNGAGRYEIATINSVKGNTITLFNSFLNKDYNYQTGKVQLVKVAKYTSATVSTTLEPEPWNGETGGVLAIVVCNDLRLDADIRADGKGFRGGRFLQNTGTFCVSYFMPDYYYNPTLQSYLFIYQNIQYGAYKGESIVDLSTGNLGGRAAVANGGGGGNNHNNGGGGGSNLARGGIGGGNVSTDGDACMGNYPGQGGYGLLSDGGNRIFLGGGGGAGHGNNTIQTGGGAGGGIIYIEAGLLISNRGKISSNGTDGGSTFGDGASGGGGGGTIILNVKNYSVPIAIEARGGKGGDEDESDNQDRRCFGAGGGGSGGVVYFKTSQPAGTVTVAEGARGEKISSPCPDNGFAFPGTAGVVVHNYAVSKSINPADECPDPIVLPVVLISFTVTNKGAQATAEWKVEKPEDAAHYVLQRKDNNGPWKDAHIIPGEAQLTTYQKGDGPLATGVYLYRLKIVEKDGSILYSAVQAITIKNEDINRLTIHPNPATSQVTIVAPSGHDEWLHIYDMESRLVYKKKIAPNDSVIRQDISFLAEGVYMIQVGKLTARFVVFK